MFRRDLFQAIAIFPSFKCNSRCRHCLANAGPDRTEELDVDTILRILDEAKKIEEIENVCFSGGEPFLYKDIHKIVEKAGGLFPLGVFMYTNCYWATSIDTAKAILSPLVVAGLRVLFLSADNFHQEFIPIQNVRNAIEAARDLDVVVIVQSTGTPTITESDLRGFSSHRARIEPDTSFIPAGRAVGMAGIKVPIESLPGCPRCALSPTVVPSGDVYACHLAAFRIEDKTDHYMAIGNIHIEPLNEILRRAQDDPIFRAVTRGGFEKLVNVIRAAGLGHRLKAEYVDHCDLCTHMLGDKDLLDALQRFY